MQLCSCRPALTTDRVLDITQAAFTRHAHQSNDFIFNDAKAEVEDEFGTFVCRGCGELLVDQTIRDEIARKRAENVALAA